MERQDAGSNGIRLPRTRRRPPDINASDRSRLAENNRTSRSSCGMSDVANFDASDGGDGIVGYVHPGDFHTSRGSGVSAHRMPVCTVWVSVLSG
jgi:hypothetical protein